jgi:hypothetical protein
MESAQPSEKPGGDGRIPFTFRIGVTGHRDLADPESFRAPIDEELCRLKELVPVSAGGRAYSRRGFGASRGCRPAGRQEGTDQ